MTDTPACKRPALSFPGEEVTMRRLINPARVFVGFLLLIARFNLTAPAFGPRFDQCPPSEYIPFDRKRIIVFANR